MSGYSSTLVADNHGPRSEGAGLSQRNTIVKNGNNRLPFEVTIDRVLKIRAPKDFVNASPDRAALKHEAVIGQTPAGIVRTAEGGDRTTVEQRFKTET